MKRIDLELQIAGPVRYIDYAKLEGRNVINAFVFSGSEWVARFHDLPIGPDDDIDLLIIVAGDYDDWTSLKININGKASKPIKRKFNRNGYAFWKKEIKV